MIFVEAYCIYNDIDIIIDHEQIPLNEADEDIIRWYLNQIKQTPLLTKEEEHELAVLSKLGDKEATNKLIESNLLLVIPIAKTKIDRGLALIDLIQEGNMGIMKAIEKFDPSLGYKFSTYATNWIHTYMDRAVDNTVRTIRIPAYGQGLLNKINVAKFNFIKTYGREPKIDELVTEVELPKEKINELLKASQELLSLNMPIKDSEETTLGDLIKNQNIQSPEDIIISKALKETISEALSTLKPKEANVLILRYGLIDDQQRTFKELVEYFGITRGGIEQIEKRALKKLRSPHIIDKLRDFH